MPIPEGCSQQMQERWDDVQRVGPSPPMTLICEGGPLSHVPFSRNPRISSRTN